MALVKCPKCEANSDVTKDGKWAHCASCNNIFEPPQPSAAGEEAETGSKQSEGDAAESKGDEKK